uniref:Probable glycerol kinase n=1 Tax=Timema genevievae TaxID=629358 RepID=A0A7R9JSZ2_TIMGE|nr:unnamed protein product [Timema genevievae]
MKEEVNICFCAVVGVVSRTEYTLVAELMRHLLPIMGRAKESIHRTTGLPDDQLFRAVFGLCLTRLVGRVTAERGVRMAVVKFLAANRGALDQRLAQCRYFATVACLTGGVVRPYLTHLHLPATACQMIGSALHTYTCLLTPVGERRGVASQPTKVSFRANKNRWITETVDGASYWTGDKDRLKKSLLRLQFNQSSQGRTPGFASSPWRKILWTPVVSYTDRAVAAVSANIYRMPALLKKQEPLIGVIDQGTEIARFVVFAAQSVREVASHSLKITLRCPREGWVEQDPMELIGAVRECIGKTVQTLQRLAVDPANMVAIGLTNQRETTVVWDRTTGEPLYNAIVWSDIRTDSTVDLILAKVPDNSKNSLMPLCGLPISPYFSALKLRWLIDNVPAVRKAIKEGRCLFGTVDSWLVWNLTGGKDGGLHVTDVTNASRTMLMNIDSLQYFGIPMSLLPDIHSSSEIYGRLTEDPLKGVAISGILGNQQASLVGEMCLEKGQAKNTYRDGCFLIYNTGTTRVQSTHGLATTIAFQMGPSSRPTYALEGSVAVAGAAVKWLKNKMRLVNRVAEVEDEAAAVNTTGDVYFVPAFSGLYAPYWRKDARG